MIEVKNLKKTYLIGQEYVHALRGVSLKIKEGDFVFVIGPSGSGKTTLLDIIGALSHPTSGEVIIDGKELSEFNDFQLAMFRRKKIGFVFQTFNLIPTLSAMDNVLIPLLPEGINPGLQDKAKNLLTEMGLGKRVNHRPAELSGGERQRVAIARALINDPLIVLADEPTGELDSKTGGELMDYMHKMNKEFNTTFVVVTHDTEYIRKSDKIFRLKDGGLVKS